MPVKEADQYLPAGDSIINALDVVNQSHFAVGRTVEEVRQAPFETLGQAASDYFTAGVAFFANRGHDEFMQEIGTTTWWSVNQQQTLVAMTDNMRGTAIQLGVPPNIALTTYSKNDESHVIFAARKEGISTKEVAFVLVPLESIVKAQNKPIEALATIAWICSQVRDMTNGRLYIDQEHFNARAAATEAHFLHEAVDQHPETQLAPEYQHTMELYPEGISSLPKKMLYRGTSSITSQSATNN